MPLGRSYKFLGFDGRDSYPRKRRWKIVAAMLAERLNPVLHAGLGAHELDQIIFVATKCPPTTALADLRAVGARNRAGLLRMLKNEADKPHMQAVLDMIVVDDQITGLPQLALKRGWLPEWDERYKKPRTPQSHAGSGPTAAAAAAAVAAQGAPALASIVGDAQEQVVAEAEAARRRDSEAVATDVGRHGEAEHREGFQGAARGSPEATQEEEGPNARTVGDERT